LRVDAAASKRRAYASGTTANLKTQWRAYFYFCLYFSLHPLPTCSNTICLFAQFLARSIKSNQALRAYIAAVRTLHLFLDMPYNINDHFVINLTLKGISKHSMHTPVQKLPISPDILLLLLGSLDLTSELDSALWASYLFAFFLCARKANLVIPSLAKFDHKKHLCRSDISITASGLVVVIKWSKTIQAGERFLLIPLLSIPNSPLCPVRAYHNMLANTPATQISPAFLYHNVKGKLVPITQHVFSARLSTALCKAGLNSALYSGHSFRRGGATWAFSVGFSAESIKLLGDWKSDSFLLYIHLSFDARLKLATKLRDSLQNFTTLTP
jgi:hypothetical protein